MKSHGQSDASGFTLLELIVALFVAAAMFAIGYGALMQAVAQREHIAASQARLAELQRAIRMLASDIAATTPRPVRDTVGDGVLPAVQSEDGTGAVISLTRGGEGHALAQGRTTLRRVQYRLDNETLVRVSWPVLDPVQGVEPRRRDLLSGVTALELRYLTSSGQWQRSWPVSSGDSSLTEGRERSRPRAIEVLLETRTEGRITRLIEIP